MSWRTAAEPPPGYGPMLAFWRPEEAERRRQVRGTVVGYTLITAVVLAGYALRDWARGVFGLHEAVLLLAIGVGCMGPVMLLVIAMQWRTALGAGTDWLRTPSGQWVDTTHLTEVHLRTSRTTRYLRLRDADHHEVDIDRTELSSSVPVWDAFYAAFVGSVRAGLIPDEDALLDVRMTQTRLRPERYVDLYEEFAPAPAAASPDPLAGSPDRAEVSRLPRRRDLPPGFVIEKLSPVGTTWYEHGVRYWAARVAATVLWASLTAVAGWMVWLVLAQVLARSRIGFVVALIVEVLVLGTVVVYPAVYQRFRQLRGRLPRVRHTRLGQAAFVLLLIVFALFSLVFMVLGLCAFVGVLLLLTVQSVRPLREVEQARARALQRLSAVRQAQSVRAGRSRAPANGRASSRWLRS